MALVKDLYHKNTPRELIILIFITTGGGLLRFWDLDVNPLWIDEAFFAQLVKSGRLKQEYPTFLLSYWLNFDSEFWLRFISALSGTLTIPAVYLVLKKNKLEAAIFVAIFPLFIFWSRLARPYAFAGLFMVLGWRWWYCNIIGILTNPLAILGTRIRKAIPLIILLIITLFIFFIREDVGEMSYGVRMLYLPLLAGVLYLTFLSHSKKIFVVLTVTSLFFLPGHKYEQWYSYEVKYADWRNKGRLTFSTNAHTSNYYNAGNAIELHSRSYPILKDYIKSGDSMSLGMDYLALDIPDYIIPPEIKEKYKERLLNGEVIRLLFYKGEIIEY